MKIRQVVFELSFPRTDILFSMKLTTFLTYFFVGVRKVKLTKLRKFKSKAPKRA